MTQTRRNKLGQITNEKLIEQKISKALLEAAEEVSLRVRPLVRDKFEETLRKNIYASYTPATEKGKAVQAYNQTHKHQIARPYHHTGTLIRNTHAIIDGDVIKIVITNEAYSNGALTSDVYNYLKFGTKDNPATDIYDYDNGEKFAPYTAQEPHNFEARTREDMKFYLAEVKTYPEQYIGKKYYKKR